MEDFLMGACFGKLMIGVLLFALALSLSATPVSAQDTMTHVCDSTLITLLYVAEHDYDFHSMSMDLATFDKGQYTPLFDAMMSEMSEGDTMATEEAMMDEMITEEAIMEDMGDMTMLAPGAVSGEDRACTALREELDTFFSQTLGHEMMEEGI
jgi:hypothetical protein